MPAAAPALGVYEGALPSDFMPHLESHLAEYGRPITREGDCVVLDFSGASVRLQARPDRFALEIRDANPVQLYQLREMAHFLLDHLCPDVAAGLVWSGVDDSAEVPPNFHMARVIGKTQLGTNFLRLEMACDGVGTLLTGGMHFSVLLPPEGEVPAWPRLDGRGRTVWPEGRAALHRAVYTFVTLDAAAGRFTFDLYLHPGSRTSQWAESAEPGATVGIMGPGGGDFPRGDHLLIAGDETALPAIRRILEYSEPGRRGTVLVETGSAGDCLPLTMPAGMELRWIDRAAGECLWDALREAPVPPAGQSRFVWVAAEQDLVRKAKAHFRTSAGLRAPEGYFSGYWVRGSSR